VDPEKSRNYLIKSENSLRIAKIALAQSAYDSAVLNAIHSSINALDAFTASHKGKRASGKHDDALLLIKGILAPKEIDDITKQFTFLLDLKNAAEYQPDMMSLKEAQDSVRCAERIFGKVKANLKPKS
jgi:hypothetical protein